MDFVLIILLFAVGCFAAFGIVVFILKRKEEKASKKKESELGIFNHPSNFKKQPVEWVQKPKSETKSKKIDSI